jgi:hypothetical protein
LIPHGLVSGVDILLVAPLLLGFHYRRTLAPFVRYGWYAALGALIIFHGILLCQEMWVNVVALREGDFLGFWINAHVAGAGHNVYDPAYGRALVRPFTISDEFRREIIDVGFWYPPPSIFVFLPLALFANPHEALLFWYGIQTAALLAAIVVIARTFLRSDGVIGIALVAALILMLPATALTVWYGQTTFLALLFTALFWKGRSSALGGVSLALAACVKPFVGALAVVLICRRRLHSLGGVAAGALVLCAATAIAFGLSMFTTYFRARPDSRIPALVYGEVSNESLLGFIVRVTHGVSGNHLSHGAVTAFGAIALVLTAITLWLCVRSEEADDQVVLAMMLSLALLIYPASQVFYSVLLIIPALVLWSRRSATFPPWIIAAGIFVGYALTIVKFPVFATLLTWATFAVLASPERLRGAISDFCSNALNYLGKLGTRNQPAYSTAMGLGIIGLVVLLCVGLQFAARPQHSFFTASGTDFRAFYCSGSAVNAKQSPYRVEPLRSCEHRVQPARGWSDALVVPAPLPGYDIAFFALLARLPYVAAKAIWFTVIVASMLVSVFFLSRLTKFPALVLLLGLCLTDAYQSIIYGQLPPLAVAALCAAAYFLQRGRHVAAAVAVGVSMIEPHLGLPASIAMFAWSARTRWPLAGVAAFLSASAAVAIGIGGNIDYFVHVLPKQAAAELVAVDQYGLAHELHVAGLSDRNALTLGSLSYVIMVFVGVLLARRISSKTGQAALIVLVPPGAALLGGAFVHGTQFAAALPAAFLLLSSARDTASRRIASFALVLLIVPWDLVIPSGARIGPIVLVSLITLVWVTLSIFSDAPVRSRSIAASAVVIAFGALLLLMHHLPGSKASFTGDPVLPGSVLVANADASENWAAYLRSESELSSPSIRDELAKIPNWLAIVLMLLVAAARSRQRDTSAEFASGEAALSSVHGY